MQPFWGPIAWSRLPALNAPKHHRFVQELPKNNYGTVLKTVLRELDLRDAG